MNVPNVKKETMPEMGNSKGTMNRTLEHGGKDSLSGENKTTEYKTKGSGFSKSNAGGMNTST